MNVAEAKRKIEHFSKNPKWYQNIILAEGLYTKAPGEDFTWDYIKKICPRNFAGARVLDIGCNAGKYCIKAYLEGAKKVVGVEHDRQYVTQAEFIKSYIEAARDGPVPITYRCASIVDAIGNLGNFDITFAFAVLYHLKVEPQRALARALAPKTKIIIARFGQAKKKLQPHELKKEKWEITSEDADGYTYNNAAIFTEAIEKGGFRTILDSRGDPDDKGNHNGNGRFYKVYQKAK